VNHACSIEPAAVPEVPPSFAPEGPLALSACGNLAIEHIGGVLRIAGGAALAPAKTAIAAAALDRAIWVVVRHGAAHALLRFDDDGRSLGEAQPLGALGDEVEIAATRRGARAALIEGSKRAMLVRERESQLSVEALGARGRDRRVLVGSRGVLDRRGRELVVPGHASLPALALPGDLESAIVVGGGAILDGATVLIELAYRSQRQLLAYHLRGGALWRRIRLGGARVVAIAEQRGLVVLARGAHIALLDVRAGGCACERILAAPPGRVLVDAEGEQIVVVDERGAVTRLDRRLCGGDALQVPGHVAPATNAAFEAMSEAPPDAEPEATPTLPEPEPSREAASSSEPAGPVGSVEAEPAREAPAVAETDPDRDFLATAPPLMADRAPAPPLSPGELAPYLEHARNFVLALCQTAQSPEASAGETAAISRFARWDRPGAPHVEIARELGLSPNASLVLHIAAAPFLFGELGKLYAAIADDRARPLVDEYLIAQILDADAGARTAIARELDDDAPLRRWGAIEIGPGARPFAALTVHPTLLRRLSGVCYERAGTPRSLAELRAPRAALAGLVRALAAQPADRPVRVALAGRTGSGRRTVAAALAQLGGRGLGLVELPPPASGEALDARVRQQLIDTALRGLVPCLTLDALGDDPGARDRMRAVLDAFPGPLIVRTPPGAAPPLSPGYLALELPALSEHERAAAWRDALAAHGLPAGPAERLAARFAIEPGTIARVLAGARLSSGADAATVEATLAAALRQHRAGRLAAIASQVTRLARWDDVILSDDMRASLRELIGRVRCRSTVLERWGMERVASSARGITALFQGGPGTGKTLAAGAIARELGFELWRVDLSRVLSKWLGETEKNLGAVFDAAEEGEIILLFDEADSLFGKRTEVRSSHDRYANVEVNYLLQRLDSFSGLAILTTNFGAAIDPAFRRRLSLHLQFPFPDEDERLRLWRAHLPPALPVAGALDLDALARKYQMSGGYIRNAALRAAYLAAAEGSALSSAHLHHAIEAEYRDHGKLGRGGALE
jgi:hypothetical protein